MAGEHVQNIQSTAGGAFNAEHQEDFQFGNSDLIVIDGAHLLFVDGVFPGGITLVDPNGLMVLADQFERTSGGAVDGTYVVLDPFMTDGSLQGTWRIRYNRGRRGADAVASGLSTASSEELMLYALIFG